MVIDIHTHIGVKKNSFNMPKDMLLKSMDKYGIDYALVSDLEAGFGSSFRKNAELIAFAKQNHKRIGVLLWCNPGDKIEDLEKLYTESPGIIKGIKIHPDIAGTPISDQSFEASLSFAEKYRLPVLVHTKYNEFSRTEFAITAAVRHPKTFFILAHMEICSDNNASLQAIKKYPNIYGDTAWVKYDIVARAEQAGVRHKILFGTDNPIAGEETYADKTYYKAYFDKMDADIMYENAKKVFDIL